MNSMSWLLLLLLFSGLTIPVACNSDSQKRAPSYDDVYPFKESPRQLPVSCPLTPAVEIGGRRRLALVVGVGDYRRYPSTRVKSLAGPVNDVTSMRRLLTDRNGFAFPVENICVLTDADATQENFETAFEEALINRIKSDSDIVVIYRAGHGSQSRDSNGDEDDGLDETFLFFDKEYVDDSYYNLLTQLHKRTHNIVVIDDACHSGTPTRGVSSEDFVERFVRPTDKALDLGMQRPSFIDRDKNLNAYLPGTIVLSAAGDDSTALERYNQGVFTTALVKVLESGESMTYAQLARRIPAIVRAQRSPQIPQFQGDLSRYVLDDNARSVPLAWEVSETEPELRLEGPPTPGFGVGAEFRIYDGALTGGALRDPERQKAMARVLEALPGANAATVCLPVAADVGPPMFKADACGSPENARDREGRRIQIGDLAILVSTADGFAKACVHIRGVGEMDSFTASEKENVKEIMAKDPEAGLYIDSDCGLGEFDVSHVDGSIVLRDASGHIRNVFRHETFEAQAKELAKALSLHARQRVLLELEGEGGELFKDDDTLRVQVVESEKQHSACANAGKIIRKGNMGEYYIPMCQKWQIMVSYSAPRKPEQDLPELNVGALMLFSNGNIIGLPQSGESIVLQPGGKPHLFSAVTTAVPPLDLPEYMLVFGTQDGNKVNWSDLADTVSERGVNDQAVGPLHRVLARALRPGTRGGNVNYASEQETAWTMSRIETRVVANAEFEEIKAEDRQPVAREYTIADFDIGPYLPLSPQSQLRAVLLKAAELAKTEVDYNQHDWNKGSDEENLRYGIDCSRAIWYAFTRAGVRYNNRSTADYRKNNPLGSYLTTAGMVGSDSAMSDSFVSCDVSKPQLGDVLVYRDDGKEDGHTVMVIDPVKRIAWGSHGWDGNPKDNPAIPFDNGVEFQRIKYKPDWRRWDRSGMEVKACWRHRLFIGSEKKVAEYDVNTTSACSRARCGRKARY